jgi:putative tryptophan/tyrosine transport system substrate-binding protein
MNRRVFITLLGGAATWSLVWPLAARAQSAIPVVGFLHSGSPDMRRDLVAAFHLGLKQLGYVEGRNVTVEYRWADDQYDRLPGLAADLVRREVAVLVAGATPAAAAAQSATATIPVVFATAGDPVTAKLVDNLARPRGNLTGISFLSNTLGAKALGLLHEVVPAAAAIGFLVNPTNPLAELDTRDARRAADELKKKLMVVHASTEADIDAVFASFDRQHADALLVESDPFLSSRRDQLIALAARRTLPAIYQMREFVAAGGLMSYGTSLTDAYQQVGIYVGRILRGARPADLPVVQSAKFEFAINLDTARSLGLSMPPGILAIADEVIE